jgi:hypothetical protein
MFLKNVSVSPCLWASPLLIILCAWKHLWTSYSNCYTSIFLPSKKKCYTLVEEEFELLNAYYNLKSNVICTLLTFATTIPHVSSLLHWIWAYSWRGTLMTCPTQCMFPLNFVLIVSALILCAYIRTASPHTGMNLSLHKHVVLSKS